LRSMLDQAKGDIFVTVSVIRALGQIGGPDAAEPIVALLAAEKLDPNVRLEAVAQLGTLKAAAARPYLPEPVPDDWPTMRATAIRAVAAIDPEGFPLLLSGM